MSTSSGAGEFSGLGFDREDLGLSATPSPPRNDTEAAIIRIFSKVLAIGNLGAEDSFFVLGGDSLRAATLLLDITYELDVSLPTSALIDAPTPRGLANLIVEKVPTKVEAPAASTTERRPLIFFHGDYSKEGFFMRTLSDVLGSGNPILPVPPPADGALRSISEMAAERLPDILARQPKGPYRLGGHCNGALVAFEAARLLVERGERVEFLVLVDPVIVNARTVPKRTISSLEWVLSAANVTIDRRDVVLQRTWSWFARRNNRHRRRMDRLKEYAGRLRAMSWQERGRAMSKVFTRPAPSDSPGAGKNKVKFRSDVELAHRTALARYFPAPLDVPVLYFALRYGGRGWNRISPNTQIIDIFSGHNRLNPLALAALRRELLARLNAESAGQHLPADDVR